MFKGHRPSLSSKYFSKVVPYFVFGNLLRGNKSKVKLNLSLKSREIKLARCFSSHSLTWIPPMKRQDNKRQGISMYIRPLWSVLHEWKDVFWNKRWYYMYLLIHRHAHWPSSGARMRMARQSPDLQWCRPALTMAHSRRVRGLRRRRGMRRWAATRTCRGLAIGGRTIRGSRRPRRRAWRATPGERHAGHRWHQPTSSGGDLRQTSTF